MQILKSGQMQNLNIIIEIQYIISLVDFIISLVISVWSMAKIKHEQELHEQRRSQSNMSKELRQIETQSRTDEKKQDYISAYIHAANIHLHTDSYWNSNNSANYYNTGYNRDCISFIVNIKLTSIGNILMTGSSTIEDR